MLLQRADHLEPGAVADVREPRVLVTPEVALQDAPVGGAVEERAPRLELLDAIGRLHRVELRHAPLIEVPPALHRVAEVDLPVVLRLHVAERRGHAAFGHDRVRLAEQRLADQAHARPFGARLDRGPQPGAARPDDQYVVLVPLELRLGGRRHGTSDVVNSRGKSSRNGSSTEARRSGGRSGCPTRPCECRDRSARPRRGSSRRRPCAAR